MFIDSATDDFSESIGRLIRNAKQEDASGSRRWYASMLASNDSKQFCQRLGASLEEFHDLRRKYFTQG